MQDFVDELIRREEFDGTVIFQQVRTFLTFNGFWEVSIKYIGAEEEEGVDLTTGLG